MMDELESYVDSLESLKYPELRRLAKKCGIKGNLKGERIIEKLRRLAFEHQKEKDRNSESSCENKNVSHSSNTDKLINEKKRNKQSNELPQKNGTNKDTMTPSSRKNTPNNNVKKNNHSGTMIPREEQSEKDLSQNKMNYLASQNNPSNMTPSTRKQLPNSGVKSKKRTSSLAKHPLARVVTPSNLTSSTKKQLQSSGATLIARVSSQGKHSVVRGVKSNKRTPSLGKHPLVSIVTPSETGSGKITKSSTSPGQRQGKKRELALSKRKSLKSASEKSQDIDSITDNFDTGTDLTSVDIHSPSQRSRRDTYTKTEASPGVGELLSVMKDDMTNEEQKNVLLDKLNERVQQSSSAKKSLLNNEPRNVGSNKAVAEKRKTPAKDWNKIHQLHWSKMDSIDEYLTKKRKRTETMTQSVKKLRMLTEQIRSNIQNVKKPNTPSSTANQYLPSKSKIPQMVKPKTAVILSPHPPVFKPKITSVSKADFNFVKDPARDVPAKTPAGQVRRSPRFNSTTNQKTGDPKGRTSVETKVMSSASKENYILSNKKSSAIKKPITTGTPFKQTLNNSLPINSTKTFNIAESLAKPITWKPHKGKLKPFQITSLYVHQTDVKEVKVKTREDRRREQNKLRAEKRHDTLSRRRAINT